MTTLWTIGHSTRTLDEFVAALKSFGIRSLVDVRRFPASRRNPQFKTDALKKGLHREGIDYVYLGDELGGWRKAAPGSPNVGLRNTSFRGYADWMDSVAFRKGIDALLRVARSGPTCVMCAERPVSNCHRRLLGDYVALVRSVEVVDIYDAGHAEPHAPTPGVRREGDGIVYEVPAGSTRLEAFDEPGP
jgi:uncharacterized protein (DUF488 family)